MTSAVVEGLIALGADGARGGWLAAGCYEDHKGHRSTRVSLCPHFEDLLALRDGTHAPVAVDIPMGLLDAVDLRPCDRQARNLLGRARQSTVFAPPSRPLLAAGGDYGRARELIAEERLTSAAGKGLSAQAAGLIPKIAEVDELFRADPDRQGWLFECHPELSFPALSGGRTLDDKRTPHGQAERLQLLAAKFADLLEVIAATRIPSQHPDLTDVLDGYAALTTALVVRAGEQRELGGELDSVGVLMRMVC